MIFYGRIPNYKVNASIFKVFDSNSEGNPATETDSQFTIVEHVTRKQNPTKKRIKLVEGLQKARKRLEIVQIWYISRKVQ